MVRECTKEIQIQIQIRQGTGGRVCAMCTGTLEAIRGTTRLWPTAHNADNLLPYHHHHFYHYDDHHNDQSLQPQEIICLCTLHG